MSFYDVLSEYYDVIFPLNNNKLNFIKSKGFRECSILDIACATGSYAIELSKLGYDVDAFDLDEDMINIALDKAKEVNLEIPFIVGNMLNISGLYKNKTFDLMYCIGNSLVHLNNNGEILKFLKSAYNKLNENGKLIIQIINYDRIFKYNLTELPTIDRKNENVKFVRNYNYNKLNHLMAFNTEIIINKNDDIKTFKHSTYLLPLRSNDMRKLLIDAGFRKIQFYGSFNEDEFNIDSYPLVLCAEK